VDQLLSLSGGHAKALGELRSLLLSFQTADVHAALETLEFRADELPSAKRDQDLLTAAKTLQKYRTWLADTRESDPARPAPARVELLRAEVLTAMAEARARMLADDAKFASEVLARVLGSARGEVAQIREEIASRGMVPSVLSRPLDEGAVLDECVEAWAWLDGHSAEQAARALLREGMSMSYQFNLQRETLSVAFETGLLPKISQLEITFRQAALIDRAGQPPSSGAVAWLSDYIDLSLTRDAKPYTASFIAAYRLARDVEAALQFTTAVEIGGTPMRALLAEGGLPTDRALVVEVVRPED
jgi:hypothetical protein